MNVLALDKHWPIGIFPGQPTPRLYDCVVEALRTRHDSCRAEEAYLHEYVLEQPLDRGVARVRKPKRLPVVLTRNEVRGILTGLDGVPRLVSAVLFSHRHLAILYTKLE
jgi:hypothetical protein